MNIPFTNNAGLKNGYMHYQTHETIKIHMKRIINQNSSINKSKTFLFGILTKYKLYDRQWLSGPYSSRVVKWQHTKVPCRRLTWYHTQ